MDVIDLFLIPIRLSARLWLIHFFQRFSHARRKGYLWAVSDSDIEPVDLDEGRSLEYIINLRGQAIFGLR